MRLLVPVLLLLTTSASPQWAKVEVPTTASLRGLSVVNDRIVWASGSGGTVVRTIDGGETWKVLRVAGAGELDLRGIHALDENDAIAISSGPAEKGQAR